MRRCALVATFTTEGSARLAASLNVVACCGVVAVLATATRVAALLEAFALFARGIDGAATVLRVSHSGLRVLTVNKIATEIVQTCAKTSHNRFSMLGSLLSEMSSMVLVGQFNRTRNLPENQTR